MGSTPQECSQCTTYQCICCEKRVGKASWSSIAHTFGLKYVLMVIRCSFVFLSLFGLPTWLGWKETFTGKSYKVCIDGLYFLRMYNGYNPSVHLVCKTCRSSIAYIFAIMIFVNGLINGLFIPLLCLSLFGLPTWAGWKETFTGDPIRGALMYFTFENVQLINAFGMKDQLRKRDWSSIAHTYVMVIIASATATQNVPLPNWWRWFTH